MAKSPSCSHHVSANNMCVGAAMQNKDEGTNQLEGTHNPVGIST